MDDDGEKKIYVGDVVTLITQTYDEQSTRRELDDILGKQPSAAEAVQDDERSDSPAEETKKLP